MANMPLEQDLHILTTPMVITTVCIQEYNPRSYAVLETMGRRILSKELLKERRSTLTTTAVTGKIKFPALSPVKEV
jgi:hypothetical protein